MYAATLPPDVNLMAVVKEQDRVLQLAWNAAVDLHFL